MSTPASHPEEQAFLRHIVATPGDLTARLVYADWLDEHGHADRAEFVRLQVRAGELPDGSPGHLDAEARMVGVADRVDPNWLPLLDRAAVENCRVTIPPGCVGRWEDLAPTRANVVRRCGRCGDDVAYCGTADDVERQRSVGRPLAVGVRARYRVAREYLLLRQLGRGYGGDVWLARRGSDGAERELRILPLRGPDPGARDRALEGAVFFRRLRHPHLLTPEAVWLADDALHVVTEPARVSLRDRLAECQRQGLVGVPAAELVAHVTGVAVAVDYLHANGVLHREVCPLTVYLVGGNARLAGSDTNLRLPLAGPDRGPDCPPRLIGRPAFMAPERLAGQEHPAGDQYSLALTYAELRQGRHPVRSASPDEALVAHLHGRYELDDVVGPAERAVLRRALARAPADRFPTCAAFAAALAAAVEPPPPPSRPARRPWWKFW